MPNYPVLTIASAPEKSKPGLEQLQQAFGVLPNLPAVIANSPKLISSLVALFAQVQGPVLSEAENQIVLLEADTVKRGRNLLRMGSRAPNSLCDGTVR